jgi:hypothetical protein
MIDFDKVDVFPGTRAMSESFYYAGQKLRKIASASKITGVIAGFECSLKTAKNCDFRLLVKGKADDVS